jgi:hypothetical protein
MGLDELQFAFIFVKELLDVLIGLVVHDIELGFEASFGEFIELYLYASKNVLSSNPLIGSTKILLDL